MADTVTKVDRFSTEVPWEAGQGKKLTDALAAGQADLIALWAYPLGGNVKIEMVPSDTAAFKTACKAAKIRVKKECAAFCVVGRNKLGALDPAVTALAAKGIRIHAVQALAVGGKYGALIEVESKDVRKAAKALGI